MRASAALETLFFDFHRSTTSKSKSRASSTTYGPHMRPDDGPGRLKLHRAGAEGTGYHHLWRGSQTRSFCFVSRSDWTACGGSMATERVCSAALLTSAIRRVHHRPTRRTGHIADPVAFKDLQSPCPRDDPRQTPPGYYPLAKRELGWQPTVPLVVGWKRRLSYSTVFSPQNHELAEIA